MGFEATEKNLSPLKLYVLPQAAYDALVRGENVDGHTLDADALYLTDLGMGIGDGEDTKVTTSSDTTTDRLYVTGCLGDDTAALKYHPDVYINCISGVLYGAAWNDYAEYRKSQEEIKPGYCVSSNDDGSVIKTNEPMQACDGIVSDTFGFVIGSTSNNQVPLAVSGRVLAYYHGNREDYHAGDTVCAGPEGKVMKMTREQIQTYPDRIIGIVSEIPEYETWGVGNVEVNGRIWIKVR